MTTQTDTAENNRLGVEYQVVGPLPAARTDMPLLLRVRVRNAGAAPWSNRGTSPINLSYHWLDTNGQVVDFEGVRAVLPEPLRPGQSVDLELPVEPPPRAGEYRLALDMVEEGVGWFSLQGIAPLSIPLAVAAGHSDVPRVCIINGNCVLNDAVGNHVLNQIRFFQARGYRTLALLDHIDRRHPAELRQHMATVAVDELRGAAENPQTRRAVRHFHSSDIYIVHYSTYYPLVEAIRLVSHGVVIFDYHGVTPPQLWDGPGLETLVEGQRNLNLVRYADYAVAHSAFTCEELLHTGAIAAERVSQMPYAVPLDRFRPGAPDPALLARYGLAPHQPVLLYVGRMATNKRIIDLVRALPLVRERFPHAALLLVGDERTPAYAAVVAEARREAAALGLAEAVIFAGQVSDAELAAHYQLADVFVIASVHEGFCIPVLEAMACGLPVVGAHATALPETIGDAGLTFRPQDPSDLAAKVIEVLEPGAENKEQRTKNKEPVGQALRGRPAENL